MNGRYRGGVRWIRRPLKSGRSYPLAFPANTALIAVKGGALLFWTFDEDEAGDYVFTCFVTNREAGKIASSNLAEVGALEAIRPTMTERIGALSTPHGTTVLAVPEGGTEEQFLDALFEAAADPAAHGRAIVDDDRYAEVANLAGGVLEEAIESVGVAVAGRGHMRPANAF